MKSHREQKRIPTDPAERRARVRWVLEHQIWTHPEPTNWPEPGRMFDFGDFGECVGFDYVYVDPTTERIEGGPGVDGPENTAFRIWVEAGPWYDQSETGNGSDLFDRWTKWGHTMDTRLCCGGASMEDVLLELASLVELFYGETREALPGFRVCCFREPTSKCVPHEDGFCVECGFSLSDRESDEEE